MPRYSEAEARAAIADAACWTHALRALGLRAAGGNFRVLKRWAGDWGISTDHFAPYAHVATHLRREPIPLDEVLVEGSTYTRSSLKRRLYDEGLKARACELCGQGERWRGRTMSLILDHVNGVHDDNRPSGSCARTARRRCRRTARATCHHERAQDAAEPSAGRARDSGIARTVVGRPPMRSARSSGGARWSGPDTSSSSRTGASLSRVAVGAKYGVSDNAVRKWMRRYERERAA